MVARGRGHLVNISSGYSTVNTPGLTPYWTTKAGLSHFTRGIAIETRAPASARRWSSRAR